MTPGLKCACCNLLRSQDTGGANRITAELGKPVFTANKA